MISTINTAVKPNDTSTQLSGQNPSSTATGSNTLATAQQAAAQTTPPVELSSSTERAYAVLSYEVSLQLNLVFGSQGVPSPTEAIAANILPKDTSGNLVSAIATAANSVDGGKRDDLVEQAHAGVDRGTTVAKDILQSQGVLSAQVNAELTTVQENIHSGISALATTDNSASVASESAFIATSSHAEDNGNIKITTNDGDTISINFNQTQDKTALAFASTGTDGSISGAASSQRSSTSYSFSVEGGLDHDERKALGKLVHDLSELSEKFFSGELNDAFEKMASLKFDTEEFSGMSIDLSHTASFLAIGAYQSVKTMSDQPTNFPATTDSAPVASAQVDLATPSAPATDVVAASTPEPANAVVEAPVVDTASGTPPANPVTAEPTTTPAVTSGLISFESLVSDVRQLIDNLNNLDLFSQPESIAVNLFEGLSLANGHDEHVATVALNQFKQLIDFESDDDDDEIELESHDHDGEHDIEDGEDKTENMI